MNDLSEYFSQQDRIKELESELIIANKKRKNQEDAKNKYKRMYRKLKGEKEVLTRKEKALSLIKNLKGTGKPYSLIKEIAERCCFSFSTVRDLWYAK